MQSRLLAFLIFFGGTALASESQPSYSEADLTRMATEPGDVETLESTPSDAVGVAGLWGLVGQFIVSHGCETSYKAVSDVEHYARRIDKVKKVEVIERKPDSLLVNYTEGGMGLEITSMTLWRFDSKNQVVTSKAVGDEDKPAWTEVRFQGVGNDGFCRITMTAFVDVSWLPNFVLDLTVSASLDELASTYRDLIEKSVEDKAKMERKGTR